MITATLKECLGRKSRFKLIEFDLKVCEELRQDILKDNGVPEIREKVLNLINEIE